MEDTFPIKHEKRALEMIGKKLKKNSVALDIVDFGEDEDGKHEKMTTLRSTHENMAAPVATATIRESSYKAKASYTGFVVCQYEKRANEWSAQCNGSSRQRMPWRRGRPIWQLMGL
ncbi:hypothetical protein GOBAR_DD04465 [Gossypium barbadense]|nr:hypothetical protein GOBAR_DD04465 [Gossypium barbadense]